MNSIELYMKNNTISSHYLLMKRTFSTTSAAVSATKKSRMKTRDKSAIRRSARNGRAKHSASVKVLGGSSEPLLGADGSLAPAHRPTVWRN